MEVVVFEVERIERSLGNGLVYFSIFVFWKRSFFLPFSSHFCRMEIDFCDIYWKYRIIIEYISNHLNIYIYNPNLNSQFTYAD